MSVGLGIGLYLFFGCIFGIAANGERSKKGHPLKDDVVAGALIGVPVFIIGLMRISAKEIFGDSE